LEVLEVIEFGVMGLDAVKKLVASLLQVRVDRKVQRFQIRIKRDGWLVGSELLKTRRELKLLLGKFGGKLVEE
jgi:hypothetical protein